MQTFRSGREQRDDAHRRWRSAGMVIGDNLGRRRNCTDLSSSGITAKTSISADRMKSFLHVVHRTHGSSSDTLHVPAFWGCSLWYNSRWQPCKSNCIQPGWSSCFIFSCEFARSSTTVLVVAGQNWLSLFIRLDYRSGHSFSGFFSGDSAKTIFTHRVGRYSPTEVIVVDHRTGAVETIVGGIGDDYSACRVSANGELMAAINRSWDEIDHMSES